MQDIVNWHAVASVFVYSAIGLLILLVGFILLDRLTPRVHIWREVNDEKNVAIAIVIGSFVIGISMIISAAVRG